MNMGGCTVMATLDLIKWHAHLEIILGFEKGSSHSTRRVKAG